jgi:hypothetical protein
MKEPNDKIKVFLCSDHFERLLKDDVCSTCPSKCENKEAVKALSALYQNNNGGAVIEAVVLELKSIRRLQEGQSADLKKIEHILQGNGKPGLVEDVISLKTLINHNNRKSNEWISWVGIVLATIISACALVATIASSV